MFRIRVRIDPDRLRGHAEIVRSGLPGIAYVLTDPDEVAAFATGFGNLMTRPVTAIAQAQGVPIAQLQNVTQRYSARSRSTT